MPVTIRVCENLPVVAIDGADDAQHLLEIARELLGATGAGLVILDLTNTTLVHPAPICRALVDWVRSGCDVRVVCQRLSGRRLLRQTDTTHEIAVFGDLAGAVAYSKEGGLRRPSTGMVGRDGSNVVDRAAAAAS